MTEHERTLLTGCLRGEKPAWDVFVLQYSALVYHTVRKTLGLYHTAPQPDQLEDLFQDFFLSLLKDDFKKLRQFRGDHGCSLANWLRVVVARLVVDFLRKQRRPTVEIPNGFPSSQPVPPGSLIDQEEQKLLSEALATLSPRDRLLVHLHYRKGLPSEEIAVILKVSVNAVYAQKSRILDKLRAILQKS